MTDMTVDLTYKFQPGKFDIAGMERFYKDMAAEGLHLFDRGAFFSSFTTGEPADMDYRVETLSSKGFMRKLTDETKQKYTDCGWEYVCMMGFTAIFRASAGTAREVYTDSYEKLYKRSVWADYPAAAAVGTYTVNELADIQRRCHGRNFSFIYHPYYRYSQCVCGADGTGSRRYNISSKADKYLAQNEKRSAYGPLPGLYLQNVLADRAGYSYYRSCGCFC